MSKSIFETNIDVVVKKDRSITMASAAGAFAGLCGVILDERSNTKTIAATAAYGVGVTALIDATVANSTPSTLECYATFGIVSAATALMGNYFNSKCGNEVSTEE